MEDNVEILGTFTFKSSNLRVVTAHVQGLEVDIARFLKSHKINWLGATCPEFLLLTPFSNSQEEQVCASQKTA